MQPWPLATLAVSVALFGPIGGVLVAATGDSEGLWRHLFETVLGRYVTTTLSLMGGVGAVTLLIGVSTAWVVSRCEFAGRQYLEWMLLLPAAVPAYIVAYTYTDFLEYAGPVQVLLREVFGWQSRVDYWFPEIRSVGGAVAIMGTALYPYVYIMARTAFRLTPASLFDVATMHDRSLLFRVGLPLARPAIVAGLALVLMETMADFGTVEFFALDTVSLGVYNVWLGMNNLPAAAQIATVGVLFVVLLLLAEFRARSQQRYAEGGRQSVGLEPVPVAGWQQAGCITLCLLPVTFGFLIPAGVLLAFVLRGYSVSAYATIAGVALNSVFVAAAVAAMVMAVAIFVVSVVAFYGDRRLKVASSLAATGYAFPGTILAIGVVTFSGAVDDVLQAVFADTLGLPFDLYITGTLALVLGACTARFYAVGFGAMTAGMNRLPPNVVGASRVLGKGYVDTLTQVVVPLTHKSVLAGGLLVFVDTMKELPMTLLLRPFNFDTLATFVYQYAKDERLEEAALPALIIVLAGLGPVFLMNAALRSVDRSPALPVPAVATTG